MLGKGGGTIFLNLLFRALTQMRHYSNNLREGRIHKPHGSVEKDIPATKNSKCQDPPKRVPAYDFYTE